MKIKGLVIKINEGIAEVAFPNIKKEICIIIPLELETVIKTGKIYVFNCLNGTVSFYVRRGEKNAFHTRK